MIFLHFFCLWYFPYTTLSTIHATLAAVVTCRYNVSHFMLTRSQHSTIFKISTIFAVAVFLLVPCKESPKHPEVQKKSTANIVVICISITALIFIHFPTNHWIDHMCRPHVPQGNGAIAQFWHKSIVVSRQVVVKKLWFVSAKVILSPILPPKTHKGTDRLTLMLSLFSLD